MYDIWSLGCILFIMLTATMPFDDSNINKMLQYQQAKKFRFPPNVEQILSRESKELVRYINQILVVNIELKNFNHISFLFRLILEPDVCKRLVINRIVNHKWLE